MSKSSGKGSILIIEDDDQLSANMALILTMEGYQVRVAGDGATGLTMMTRKKPDIILCDILLPEMDGYEVFKRIKSNPLLAKIPFLFISALNERHQIRCGMMHGADDYLGKPFSSEELLAAVTTRLEQFAAMFPAHPGKPLGAAADHEAQLARLTRREREILLLVADGLTSREIASTLYISHRTVEVHRAKLMNKLDAANAIALASWAEVLKQSEPGAG